MIGATPPSSMCRGEPPPAAVRVCASLPESLILSLRGANPAPGKAPGGGVSLRSPPGKGLFFR